MCVCVASNFYAVPGNPGTPCVPKYLVQQRRRDAWFLFAPAAHDISPSARCQCDPRWEFHYRGCDLCGIPVPARSGTRTGGHFSMKWKRASSSFRALCAPPREWRAQNVCRGYGYTGVVFISDAIFAPRDLARGGKRHLIYSDREGDKIDHYR